MEGSVQLLGIGRDPIVLRSTHLHGDRQQLVQDPERTHLFIRRILPKSQTLSGTGRSWRALSSRCAMPAVDKPTRTFFDGNVYPHIQHAFLACLIRTLCGTTRFKYQPHAFPMVYAEGSGLCPAVTDACMGLHWIANDPSHSQLCDFGQHLLRTAVRWCMLVIGPMQPVPSRWPPERPQLRGILIDASRFSAGNACLPPDAIQPGWYACQAPHLVFALHGECDGRALPPAVLPSLSNMGICLWKYADQTYALDGKKRNADAWDLDIAKSDEVPTNSFYINPVTDTHQE